MSEPALEPDAPGNPYANNGAVAVSSLVVPTLAELKAAGVEELDEIEEDAFFILRRRLKQARANPGKAGKLEDTHLISLCTNLMRHRASLKKGTDGDGKAPQVVNITNLLSGLPPERARELMVAAVKQLEGAGQDASAQREALATLVGFDEMGRLLAIEVEAGA